MLGNASTFTRHKASAAELSISLGLSAVVLFFLASGILSYWNTRELRAETIDATRTHEIIMSMERIQSIMKDAETGQRGYLLTGDEKYLAPYSAALERIDSEIDRCKDLTAGDETVQSQIPELTAHIRSKLKELDETINLRRLRGLGAALPVVVSDRGKSEMDALRFQVSQMEKRAEDIRAKRLVAMAQAYRIALVSGIITGLLGMLLSGVVAYLVRRAVWTRRQQQWLQGGEIGLAKAMLGEQRVEMLGENVLKFLAEYFNAHAGAFFAREGSAFTRVATYGVSGGRGMLARFEGGGGLLGQAVKDNKTFVFNDVPDGYLTISSSMGRGRPRHLVISPASVDGKVVAVIELGFIHPVDSLATELLEQIADSVGVAVQSANYRANLQNFLEETQRQAEELQAQSAELRVANEELEGHSRSIRESQARLEEQQVELEQTNAQLEEQTQVLESQRDNLTRAQAALQLKAKEVERASRYKSDFLANMSHELRTPLNSSLILAKLLADNPDGNLSAEQVKFAETIESAGNDLLSLINDILDLSKIEAGHMDVHAESLTLARLVKDLKRVMTPLAAEKGLVFETAIEDGCPKTIEVDRRRLEQVLRNLLSNAIKFTERGSVRLTTRAEDAGRIAFAITDTGIGIPDDQQRAIFEAFRQADGTISRKYGGTGLGLSISRELTRLLGGEIHLESRLGQGSTFTVVMPQHYDAAAMRPANADVTDRAFNGARLADAPVRDATDWGATGWDTEGLNLPGLVSPARGAAASPVRVGTIEDDRDQFDPNSRTILVVEDDAVFARMLYDLVHELDFQCLIAPTAEEALSVARQYLPSAVVLDVGLPDHSGLAVLDRLKSDLRTRHIPVHVVSGGDNAETALALGAAGHMLKPVKRDELVEALARLETRLSQRVRRVVIVEDDPVQRESVGKLLASREVEAILVGSATECLEKLKEASVDCMVLDLSLPDASGYELLEALAQEDTYSFPPVIIHTARELSAEEEQRLRKYSSSIIIKGAKSSERLLDEVTLFLHQVVADLPAEQQKMLQKANGRDAMLKARRILVVEDDIRNVYALTSVFEPRGAIVEIARNGREALDLLAKRQASATDRIDLVLMDVMMPEMDGLTATREIRKKSEWKKLPIIMLTAKAMKDDQERCLEAGASDYVAKPLDVEKLLSLVRVWMPR
ncbi:MAG: response regulator [Pseudomonadota bacterium]|nr:response regulator [Pseudomonadota bacterium]